MGMRMGRGCKTKGGHSLEQLAITKEAEVRAKEVFRFPLSNLLIYTVGAVVLIRMDFISKV